MPHHVGKAERIIVLILGYSKFYGQRVATYYYRVKFYRGQQNSTRPTSLNDHDSKKYERPIDPPVAASVPILHFSHLTAMKNSPTRVETLVSSCANKVGLAVGISTPVRGSNLSSYGPFLLCLIRQTAAQHI